MFLPHYFSTVNFFCPLDSQSFFVCLACLSLNNSSVADHFGIPVRKAISGACFYLTTCKDAYQHAHANLALTRCFLIHSIKVHFARLPLQGNWLPVAMGQLCISLAFGVALVVMSMGASSARNQPLILNGKTISPRKGFGL